MNALEKILAQPKVTHDLVQGLPEWDAFRLQHRGASEAAAAMGLSRHMKRTELLHMKHSGLAREFSDWLQAHVLDRGHDTEAAARPHVEAQLGEDLYPVTCSRGLLSASCDGITLDDETAFEHKQWNEDLASMVRAGLVPDEHMPQCQQILLVTGAKRVRFTVSDGTPERMVWVDVEPDTAWWERIAAAWEQFDRDLASYVPSTPVEKIIAEPVEALPAPYVEVTGQLTLKDNFKVFEQRARHFLEHKLIRNPKTDEDFVNLDAQIKEMKQGREALKSSKAQMLAQVQPIDQATKTADMLDKMLQQACSMAEDLMQREKERRKGEIVRAGIDALAEHIAALNVRLGYPLMPATATAVDFGGAIKGMRSLASMEDAIGVKLANAKIGANAIADRIQMNLRTIDAHPEHAALFADRATLVLKDSEACTVIVAARIAEAKAAEERKLEAERQRIRQEEEARAAAIARQQESERQAAESRAHREQEEAAAKAAALARVAEAGKAAEWPQAGPQNPVQAPTAPAANTTPMQQLRAAAAPLVRGEPTLRLGDLCARFGPGVTLTAAYLEARGFPPARRDRNAALFHEEDVPAICDAIAAHVMAVKHAHQQKAA
jgi:predicted phage-related endonuclease